MRVDFASSSHIVQITQQRARQMPACLKRRILAPGETMLSIETGTPPVDTVAVIR